CVMLVRSHGPRNATSGFPSTRFTSVGMYGSPCWHGSFCSTRRTTGADRSASGRSPMSASTTGATAAATVATAAHATVWRTPSDHRVLPRRLAEPLGAQLRDALERVEVDVYQPEAGAVTVPPLEVVLRAPEE